MNREKHVSKGTALRYIRRFKGGILEYNTHYSILTDAKGKKLCFIAHKPKPSGDYFSDEKPREILEVAC